MSELYASLLMVGVTLSFGSFVTLAAVNQFNLSANSYSLAGAVQEQSAGKSVSFLFSSVSGSGCSQSYRGSAEGASLAIAVYDYGSVPYQPTEVFVNGTLYAVSWNVVPGAVSINTLTLLSGTCAHAAGQNVQLVDASGDGVQFGT